MFSCIVPDSAIAVSGLRQYNTIMTPSPLPGGRLGWGWFVMVLDRVPRIALRCIRATLLQYPQRVEGIIWDSSDLLYKLVPRTGVNYESNKRSCYFHLIASDILKISVITFEYQRFKI